MHAIQAININDINDGINEKIQIEEYRATYLHLIESQ